MVRMKIEKKICVRNFLNWNIITRSRGNNCILKSAKIMFENKEILGHELSDQKDNVLGLEEMTTC